MSDAANQREARRLKLMKNAENRMNRLCGTESESTTSKLEGETDLSNAEGLNIPKSGIKDFDTKQQPETLSDNAKSEQNNEARTSPYNLRHRINQTSSHESLAQSQPSEQKTSSVPYKIVEDPEVPSLAEFLATQEAAKTAEGRAKVPSHISNQQMNSSYTPRNKIISSERSIEYIRIIGIFFTSLLSRWSLNYSFGLDYFFLEIIFQSMFFPFVLFELFTSYVIQAYMQPTSSSTPQGSLLSTALVLCGVRPGLIQIYNKIMCQVTILSNDFFLYIFAFLVWHAVLGY